MSDSFVFGITPFIHNMDKNQQGTAPAVKKITENGKYDTTQNIAVDVNVASSQPQPEPVDPTDFAHKLVRIDLGEAEYFPEYEYSAYRLYDAGSELFGLMQQICWELSYAIPFYFICEGKEYVIVDYTADDARLIDLVDIYPNDITAEEHHTFNQIWMEQDAETGEGFVYISKN